MASTLPWIPALPLLSSALLLIAGARLSPRWVAVFGVGSVGLAALLTAALIAQFDAGGAPLQTQLAPWFAVAGLATSFSFYVDGLTLVMLGVITGVGLLIHAYASAYMAGEEGYARFFGYLNLFVAAMLVLVLAEDLLLLYLGWEGVGLCSYLLIGFWYRDADNGYCARKAFVVTRIGDVALAIALFMLIQHFGELNIQVLMGLVKQQWAGTDWPTWVALLMLLGAAGKSAQLPLQTWLPDAMAGPTPVSALIHAATMVTAGVYLIARCHPLFELSPPAMAVVAWVGALTLLLAACSALVQTDLKRVLAYSTISQIGYMFYALGAGAFAAAVFHLMTHAFFKALLFLAAGQVILSLHHEQDIRRMGGLWRALPFSGICFAIGCAALAALPLTSGFYSKDAILLQGYALQGGGAWYLALAGAGVTALYSLRLFLKLFFGEQITAPAPDNRRAMLLPLAALCALSLLGGAIEQPLGRVFAPLADIEVAGAVHGAIVVAPWLGLALGLALWLYGTDWRRRWAESAVARWWRAGWGFDAVYEALLLRPLLALAHINRADVLDRLVALLALLARLGHEGMAALQSGRLRWYAAVMVAGAVFTVAVVNA